MANKKHATFGEAMASYRAQLHAEGRLTMDTERRLASLIPRWTKVPLEEIEAEAVYTYFRTKYKYRKNNTIARNMGTFKAILHHAVEMGWYARPLILRIPRKSRNDERIVHLEAEEIEPVVEYLNDVYGPLTAFSILLLIDTGVRFGEALKLRWCDVGKDWVLVRSSDYENSKTIPRRIPASPRMLRFMQDNGIVPASDTDPKQSMLLNLYNKHPSHIGRELREALTEATVATGCLYADHGIRLHDLRHTFAYLCAKAGADVGDIRELMGHRNIAMTMRYRGFIDSRAKEIIRKGMQVKSGA